MKAARYLYQMKCFSFLSLFFLNLIGGDFRLDFILLLKFKISLLVLELTLQKPFEFYEMT